MHVDLSQTHTTALVATVAVIFLVACGGGGGGSGNPGPALDQVRDLTDAAPPAEAPGDQKARAAGIISRADSFLVSTLYADTSSRELPALTIGSSCTATACTFSNRALGLFRTISLSNLESFSLNPQSVGTMHGVTVLREAGRRSGTDYRTLGAWMEHSGFSVQMESFTEGGVRIDGRSGIALGDLTGSRPLGSATWRGAMVGTPATGTGRGDRLLGDAILTYDMGSGLLDAAFTNIRNTDRLRAHTTAAVRFDDISVGPRGTFSAGLAGNRIQGGFAGPGHAEAAGVFEQANMVGSFGVKR